MIVRVGVGVIVIRGSRILLIKRAGSHGEGTWSTPGGYLEFGETLAACALREAYEETGAILENARFRAVTNDVMIDEGKHHVTVWMEADWTDRGVIQGHPQEIADIGWFDLDELPSPIFRPFMSLLSEGSWRH